MNIGKLHKLHTTGFTGEFVYLGSGTNSLSLETQYIPFTWQDLFTC